jgi:hypothetical protein
MVMLPTVGLGFVGAVLRSRLGRRRLSPPRLHGLVPAAFLPQAIAFYLPGLLQLPDMWASVGLIVSQMGLLIFAIINRRHTGMRAMGIGLALNMLVVSQNGGWMPISHETLVRLEPLTAAEDWVVGSRFDTSKDVVLPSTQTHLPWLADRFVLPLEGPCRVAFSIGDVVIVPGALCFTWALGGRPSDAHG